MTPFTLESPIRFVGCDDNAIRFDARLPEKVSGHKLETWAQMLDESSIA